MKRSAIVTLVLITGCVQEDTMEHAYYDKAENCKKDWEIDCASEKDSEDGNTYYYSPAFYCSNGVIYYDGRPYTKTISPISTYTIASGAEATAMHGNITRSGFGKMGGYHTGSGG